MLKSKFNRVLLSGALLSTVVSPFLSTGVLAAPKNATSMPQTDRVSKTVPENVTVNIHKLQSTKLSEDLPFANLNGNPLTPEEIEALGTNVKPLEGVEFSYVVVPYSTKLTDVVNLTPEQIEEKFGSGTVIGTTNDQGLYSWTMPALKEEQGQYLVYESDYTPALDEKDQVISSGVAVPFLIAGVLGASDGSGYLTEVDVYPKNTVGRIPVVGKDVRALNDNEEGYKVGVTFPYILKGSVPTNIHEYQTYTFEDTLDSNLDYQGVSEVSVAGTELEEGTHYKVVVGRGFDTEDESIIENTQALGQAGVTVRVELTTEGIARVAELVPFENRGTLNATSIEEVTENNLDTPFVQVTLNAKLNETTVAGKLVENRTLILFNSSRSGGKVQPTGLSEIVQVLSGGKRFKKTKTDGVTPLANARFELQNEDGSEVTWNDDLKEVNADAIAAGSFAIADPDAQGGYRTVTEASELLNGSQIILNSKSDGTFEIQGLAVQHTEDEVDLKNGVYMSTYLLKEVQAPEGHQLLVEPVKFDVDEYSYYEDVETLIAAENLVIENKENPSIPATGGVGALLAVVGSALGLGYITKRKNKQ